MKHDRTRPSQLPVTLFTVADGAASCRTGQLALLFTLRGFKKAMDDMHMLRSRLMI